MQGAGEQDITQSDTPETKGAGKPTQSTAQRWLTAAIAIPLVLLCVWFGGWVAFAATTLVVMLATFELYNMLIHAGYRPLIWMSVGINLLLLLAAMFPAQRLLIIQTTLSLALLVPFPVLFFRKRLDGAMLDWALTLAISLFVGWPMSFFLLLRGSESSSLLTSSGLSLYIPPGVWWLLLVFLGVWGFDSAAFFTGRYFGRHKLAPNISPAKTWEGVLGGFVVSIIAALLCAVRPLGVPWFLAIMLGILVGIAAVVGDLSESLIKRQTHVKDSGQIMPGHGGMLDRIDSLLFAVIIVYMFVQLYQG